MCIIVTIHGIMRTSSLSKTLKTLILSLAVSGVGAGLLAEPILHFASGEAVTPSKFLTW